MGTVWGVILAVLILLVLYKKINKRIEKEAEIINVIRPEESGGSELRDNGAEPEIDNRVGGDEVERKIKGKWRIPFKSPKTNDSDESEHSKPDKRSKSGSLPYPLFKPFESRI